MSCAQFRESILEAALTPARDAYESGLRPGLRAHLADCAACRELLAQERALAGSIDAGLRARVAGGPSAEFVARIRQRIGAEPATASWFRRWQPTLAGAMVLVIAVTVWFSAPERIAVPPQQPVSSTPQPAGPISPRPTESVTTGADQGIRPEASLRPNVARPPQEAQAPELWAEVLIEPREREGVRWLHAALQSRASRIAAVLAGQGATREDPLRPLGFADLQVAPVEIAPMSSGSEAGGGKSVAQQEK